MFYLSLIEDEQDKITFDYIYHHYRKQMLAVATRFSVTHEDAEDAVQEAFIRIALKIKQIPTGDRGKQKAYILTIVKHIALNIRQSEDSAFIHLDNAASYRSASQDPFDEVMKSEDYNALLSAILALPTHYQEVLMFRFVIDIPLKDVARLLGRKEATVKQQITRGKKLLQEHYMKEVV